MWRVGIGRRSPGLLLFGFILGVLRSARLALRLKPFERRPRSSGALLNITRRALPRGLPSTRRSPRIARKLLLEGGHTLRSTAASILSSFSPVLNNPLLALARIFVPSTAISASLTSPSPINAVTLCVQQPVENLGAFDPEIGEPVIVQRHAARQPPIGGVALGKPLQFARRPYPFDRRIEPQRKQNREIGGRPARLPLARPYPLIKLRRIAALDETPDDARAMVRRQKPLEIDHIPAQLTPIRPHHPSFRHRRFAHISDRESQQGRKDHFFTRSQAGMTRRRCGALIRPVSPATFSQGEKGRRPHPALRATPGSSPGRLFSQREKGEPYERAALTSDGSGL